VNSKFLSTQLATEWPEDVSDVGRLGGFLRLLIPEANPGYEGRMHLVNRWLIEIDPRGQPGREIGLDAKNGIVVAAPSDRDYGFWCDTTMTETDLTGNEISPAEFERYWDLSAQFRDEK